MPSALRRIERYADYIVLVGANLKKTMIASLRDGEAQRCHLPLSFWDLGAQCSLQFMLEEGIVFLKSVPRSEKSSCKTVVMSTPRSKLARMHGTLVRKHTLCRNFFESVCCVLESQSGSARFSFGVFLNETFT